MRAVRPPLYEARKFGGCVARWQVCSGNWNPKHHACVQYYLLRSPIPTHTQGQRRLRHASNFWSP